MAIIKCPSCGMEISNKAKVCPKCGIPIAGNVWKYYINFASKALADGNLELSKEYVLKAKQNDQYNPTVLEWETEVNRRIEEHEKEKIENTYKLVLQYKNKSEYRKAYILLEDLVASDPNNSNYIKLQNDIKWQIGRKWRLLHRVLWLLFFIVLICGFCFGVYKWFASTQKSEESSLWDKVQKYERIEDCDSYIVKYPTGFHIEDVKDLRSKIKDENDAWNTAANENTCDALMNFAEKYPDSKYTAFAMARSEQLLWNTILRAGTKENYNKYIELFPSGKHAQEANNELKKIYNLEVSDNDVNTVRSAISVFFSAIASNDVSSVAQCVAPVMNSFLGRKYATKANVLYFMKKMHSDDIYDIRYNVDDDLQVKKYQISDNEYGYSGSCSVDLNINRGNQNKITFENFSVNFTLDNSLKLTKLSMRKISSY